LQSRPGEAQERKQHLPGDLRRVGRWVILRGNLDHVAAYYIDAQAASENRQGLGRS
jgi:hypothetical protein